MAKKLSDISARARRDQLISILTTATSPIAISTIVSKLAARGIDVTSKTIGRDIDELSLDYDISEYGQKPRKFKINSKKTVAVLELNRTELQALAISLSSLEASSHDIFKEPLVRLEAAILKNLSSERVKEYERTKSEYVFTSSSGRPTGGEKSDLESLLYVLRQRRQFKAYYISPYKKEAKRLRVFSPLRLVMNSGVPYLDAFDMESKALRRLRLSRFLNVKPLPDSVDEKLMKKLKPVEESFGAYSSSEAINVKLQGDEVLVNFFEEKCIHSSQQLERLKNTGCVSLRVPLSSELTRLVASLAPHITEISPKKLKDEVRILLSQGLRSVKSKT